MKRTILLLTLLLVLSLLTGCASSQMHVEKTLLDGTVIEYDVRLNSLFQDLSGQDLSATLDPEGQTTVNAGAVDATGSQISADVAASMVEMLKIMLPYLVAPVPVPVVP